MVRAQRRRHHRYKNKKKKVPSIPSVDPTETTRVYSFHQRYVREVPKTKRELRNLRKKLQRDREKGGRPMEVRLSYNHATAYLVPALQWGVSTKTNTSTQKRKSRKTPMSEDESSSSTTPPRKKDSILYIYSRWLTLRAMDHLVSYQEIENDKLRKQAMQTDCCP